MKPDFKKHFIFWLAFLLILIMVFTTWQLQSEFLDNIKIVEGESYYVNIFLPFIYARANRNDIILLNGNPLSPQSRQVISPLNLEALRLGQVKLELTLFGLIPLRQIIVDVLPEVYLFPGGHSIGIKLNSQGVSVVGYYYFEEAGHSRSPGREAGVRVGDTIIAVDGQIVTDINQAAYLLNEAVEKRINKQLSLLINRNGKEITIRLTPLYSEIDGGYRIGLYIRDSAAGVGTLSYYNPDTGRYGALGHMIIDSDTGKPIKIDNGRIVQARIISIQAARRGRPGEKTGIFVDYEGLSGNIEQNTPFGIFGMMNSFNTQQSIYRHALPLALIGQVETGPAEMLTVIDGENIGSYAVEIERIAHQRSPTDKGIIFRVVDETLLSKTGGIIQGMSGSPLIQNGRLIGAVTHVFVNDPTRGYAIFMEWMYLEDKQYQDLVN